MYQGRTRSASRMVSSKVGLRTTSPLKNSSCDFPDFWKSRLSVTTPTEVTPSRKGICQAHARPNPVRMPEQQQIHVVPLDVEAVGARGVRRDKVCGADGHELPDRRPRGSPSDAVLVDEPGVLHLR